VGVLVFCGLLLLGMEFPRSAWLDEYGYAQKYHVTIDLVHASPKPKDCDWLQTPIGDKGCHYERRVSIKVVTHNLMGQDLDQDMTESEYQKAATEINRYDPPVPPRVTSIQILWLKVAGHREQ
jgi:hypothetical protein